jgi:tetratricopeptide (TPR) repeat protein
MTDVFISYSRRDSAFVRRLTNTLTAADRSTWIDWADIPQAEDWWKEIQTGIDHADNMVCILTEHWLTSEICHQELSHAREQNKRIFPIIRQRIEGDTEHRIKGEWMDTAWEQAARDNWEYLGHLNWIFFEDDTAFGSQCQILFKALDADQPHIKAHTRYGLRAQEWERAGQNPSFLLTGDNLIFAEQWLSASPGKDPAPTDLQRLHLAASRQAEDARTAAVHQTEQRIRRLRRTAWAAGLVGVLALVATSVAGVTSLNAISTNATSQAQLSTATFALATGTQVANRVIAGETQSADLGRQAAEAGGTLTQVPPTLTLVAQRIDGLVTHTARLNDTSNALLFLTNGSQQAALAALNRTIALDPGNDVALVSRAIIYMADEDYARALADVNAALDAIEGDTSGFYDAELRAVARSGNLQQRAAIYILLGDTAAAQADLDEANVLTPDDPSIFSAQGDLAVARGDLESALAAYNRAIGLDESRDVVYYSRAELYRRLGDYDAAMADYRRTIELEPYSVGAYTGLAEIYRLLGNYDAAIDIVSQGLRLQPAPLLYIDRGRTHDTLDNLDAALDDFSQAIVLEPDEPLYHYLRAGIYRQQGRYGAALDDIDFAIEADADEALYVYERARIYLAQDDLQAALADGTRAIELAPPNAPDLYLYFFNRGLTYNNLRDNERALADYNRAIELQPDYALAYYNRAITYLLQGQGGEGNALPDIDRYIELMPDDPDGYYIRALTRVTLHLDQDLPATPADLQAIITDYRQVEFLGRPLTAADRSNIDRAQQMLTITPAPTAPVDEAVASSG